MSNEDFEIGTCRDIKFRAKTVYKPQWVYGYFVRNTNGDCYIYEGNGLSHLVQEATVGLLVTVNSDQEEVYDGDYLEDDSGIVYEVLYINFQEFRYGLAAIGHDDEVIDAFKRSINPIRDFKLVGNKWDGIRK